MTTTTSTHPDIAALGPTVDLATAATMLGIGRTVSYELVRTGQFPVRILRIGRLIRVPTAPLLQLLGIEHSPE
jgi:predicted DNA-binding transcriptional regulator AlpA